MSKIKIIFSFLGILLGVQLIVLIIPSSFEFRLYDLKLRLFARKIQSDIILIDIDDSSLAFYQQNFSIGWPWPRSFYARMLKTLGSARVVGFDLIFSEASIYEGEDEKLARQIVGSRKVFLPLIFKSEAKSSPSVEAFALPEFFLKLEPPEFKSVLLPLKVFLQSAVGAGAVNQNPCEDGLYRRLSHFYLYRNRVYPSFVFAIFRYLKNKDFEKELKKIPFDRKGRLLIKFYQPKSFSVYSAAEVIQSAVQVERGIKPQLEMNVFENKIVFIGTTAAGLLDLRPHPLDEKGAGFEIQAQALENLLRNDFIREVNPLFSFLLISFCGFLLHITLLRSNRLSVEILLLAGTILFLIVINLLLFSLNVQFELIRPFVLFMVIGFFNGYYGYSRIRKEKLFIQNLFKNYLSEKLLNEILRNPKLLRLGGERVAVTVFFSDLEGFTSLSEKLPPEELVNLLNTYLNRMTEVILKNDGYLDKFEGDAIMAFWGAPFAQKNQKELAALSALQCQKELDLLNEQFLKRGLPQLKMRIGINSGPAIAGNIGSEKRFEYTLIGDAVNFASRLEGLNKFYQTTIILGEECALSLSSNFVIRRLDRLRVKGKEQVTEVYELIGEKEEIPVERLEYLKLFNNALLLYFRGDFVSALDGFQGLASVDSVSAVFERRCRILLKEPPESWDGVWSYAEK